MVSLSGLGSVLAALVAGVLAVPALAAPAQPKKDPAKKPGVLHVYDGGAMFTEKGIDKAKAALGKTQFERETVLTIDTHSVIPKDRKVPEDAGERAKFFQDWAKAEAAGDKAKGVFVLVCRSPGYVQVIVDKATRDRGFTAENEQRLRDLLTDGFKNAAKETDDVKKFEARDKSLVAATDYIASVLKGTVK